MSAETHFVMPILRPRVSDPIAVVRFLDTAQIRKWAQANHYQTLERLRDRGGLSWCELAAVLEGRKWKALPVAEARDRALARSTLVDVR